MAENARTEDPNYRAVPVERIGKKHYRATGANGATLDFGQGETQGQGQGNVPFTAGGSEAQATRTWTAMRSEVGAALGAEPEPVGSDTVRTELKEDCLLV